jgi:hypothetical protein
VRGLLRQVPTNRLFLPLVMTLETLKKVQRKTCVRIQLLFVWYRWCLSFLLAW